MRNEKNLGKLTYAQPELCTYGGFADLTASGSTGLAEPSMTVNVNRIRP
jgi:hypothetical protein